jgi:PAS domain S-box-containing protein
LDRFKHCIETGEVWEDTFPLRGKDGNYRWFLSRAMPIRDAEGRVVRWFGTNTDITGQLEIEQRLRESERRLAAIVENMTEGLIVVDPAGQTLHWNRAALRMRGYERQEAPLGDMLQAAELLELATPDGKVAPFEQWPIPRLLRGEHFSDCEMLFRHKGKGWERIFSYGGTLIRDDRGEPWMGVLTIRDVTAPKRAEEALLESERHFRELADSMPQLVWITEPDGRHIYFNRRWYEQIGVDADASLGERWSELLHPEDRERCLAYWRQCLQSGEPYQIEYRFRVASGEYRWFLGRAVPVRDGHGRITRWFGTCTDIEDSKRAEAALRQAQKLESVGLLAGGIAHDFNNLLVGVIGNASLAATLLPPRHAAAGILQLVVESGEQAAHLTRQLLAYAGKGRFIVEPVDLSALVIEARALIESSVSKKVSFQFDLNPDIPAVETDPSQMQQVLMNLALNAAEAIGGEPGLITIATGEVVAGEEYTASRLRAGWQIAPGRYALLEVADTGCGMDTAIVEKIFDPFFTTKFHGRGLGLAAVAGIVRSHKGAIEVSSAPGAGTTFRVLFPAAKTRPAATRAPQQQPENLRGTGTVMVVDDEPVVRDLARHALERQGYDVLLAESGPAAIELIRNGGRGVALVVLDLSMPGLSGKETLERLRQYRPDLNVVVSSGYSETEALRLFRGVPVSGFIQKPYTVAQLARAVKRALAG